MSTQETIHRNTTTDDATWKATPWCFTTTAQMMHDVMEGVLSTTNLHIIMMFEKTSNSNTNTKF
jgi:hypothetical protein